MLEYIPAIGEWLQSLIRGGSDIGPATLSIFFAVHTAVTTTILKLMKNQNPATKIPDTKILSVKANPSLGCNLGIDVAG
jgi:hypothetical protein